MGVTIPVVNGLGEDVLAAVTVELVDWWRER